MVSVPAGFDGLLGLGRPIFAAAIVAFGIETVIVARSVSHPLGPQYNGLPVIPWLPAIPWVGYLFGAIWVALPCVCLLWLAHDGLAGRVTLLWLLAVVWATDIGAYKWHTAHADIEAHGYRHKDVTPTARIVACPERCITLHTGSARTCQNEWTCLWP